MPPILLGIQRTKEGIRFRILPEIFPKEAEENSESDEGVLNKLIKTLLTIILVIFLIGALYIGFKMAMNFGVFVEYGYDLMGALTGGVFGWLNPFDSPEDDVNPFKAVSDNTSSLLGKIWDALTFRNGTSDRPIYLT